MTDISEVQASINRSNLSLEEINKEAEDTLKLVLKGFKDLASPIEDLINSEKKQNEEISNYDSSNMSLSKEISSLKEEKSRNETLQSNTQNTFNEATEKRTKLEGKIRETKTNLDNAKNKLTLTKEEQEKVSIENDKLTAEIDQLVQTSDNQILELNKKSDQKRDSLRKVKGERMALEYLIKRNYIEFNEMKIISSLEGRRATDMSTISKVTGLSENLIEKTLNGLMQRNLLTYDSSTGAINVTGNLKL